jgi:flagellar basal-body rod modification protein FlgD
MMASTNLVSANGASGASIGSTEQASQSTSQLGTDELATKDAFLKLLVAQIRYQNPLNPADGVQFLTQLAQFSELEQMISIREELTGLHTDLKNVMTSTAKDTNNADAVSQKD